MLRGRFDVEKALVDAAAVVLCTCPDEETAARIARKLVDDGLAACVNRLAGVVSTYRWQGRIEEDTEQLLVIKTASARIDAIVRRIGELHPYELPEVIAVPIDAGSAAYLEWVVSNSAPSNPDGTIERGLKKRESG